MSVCGPVGNARLGFASFAAILNACRGAIRVVVGEHDHMVGEQSARTCLHEAASVSGPFGSCEPGPVSAWGPLARRLPLALGFGAGSELQRPLAVATLCGRPRVLVSRSPRPTAAGDTVASHGPPCFAQNSAGVTIGQRSARDNRSWSPVVR